MVLDVCNGIKTRFVVLVVVVVVVVGEILVFNKELLSSVRNRLVLLLVDGTDKRLATSGVLLSIIDV